MSDPARQMPTAEVRTQRDGSECERTGPAGRGKRAQTLEEAVTLMQLVRQLCGAIPSL